MFKKIFLISVLLFFTNNVCAQTPVQTFKTANEAYLARDFQKAETLYQELEKQGILSGGLFFNLGNTFYRQGKVGEAIYYYEKALRLSPRDRDLSANYNYIRERLIDKIEEPLLNKILSYAFFWNALLSLKEGLFFTLGAYALLFALLISRLYFKSRMQFLCLLFLVFVNLLSLSSFSLKLIEEKLLRYGVLFASNQGVFSEPTEQSVRLFELHEGAKIKISEEQNGFYKVQWVDGKKGWMKKETIGNI
ncbi:MAG: tetratricopeptide repeat protein [Deltaproteobacteria bacterium]|nr:tetratricopeptide repeat protein [Deltaproteobacteria bacterium]